LIFIYGVGLCVYILIDEDWNVRHCYIMVICGLFIDAVNEL